ncbi:hypothetical protein PENTCL1PPCAC_30811, partial [Pristionchus entomophagus]
RTIPSSLLFQDTPTSQSRLPTAITALPNMHLSFVVIASVAALGYASPLRKQRNIEDYCDRHSSLFERYCGGRLSDFDTATRSKLERFCPEYEEACQGGKGYSAVNLVVPPPLPKSSNLNFDLPIGRDAKKPRVVTDKSGALVHGLTAEVVATCTPDCVDSHCTTTCKCAYTHPRVHAMCNPPATRRPRAPVCANWYSKCTMFQPVAYD